MRDRAADPLLAPPLTHERLLLALIVAYFAISMALLIYLEHAAMRAIERAALGRVNPVAQARRRKSQ